MSTLGGQDPYSLTEPDLARFRNEHVGFVFQDHHLLPQLSVLENVLVPLLADGKVTQQLETRARELIDRVGLGERLSHRPAEFSGGERGRVAVARALIAKPQTDPGRRADWQPRSVHSAVGGRTAAKTPARRKHHADRRYSQHRNCRHSCSDELKSTKGCCWQKPDLKRRSADGKCFVSPIQRFTNGVLLGPIREQAVTFLKLAIRSLSYYWRINVTVALGVAAATAVLTGALVVGDSVRESLTARHLRPPRTD